MNLVINDRRHHAKLLRDKNHIPPITDELGLGWNQPNPECIALDDTHAVMSKRVFDALPEYSGTFPTGVYEGKMWKRYNGVYDTQFLAAGGKPEWLLMWYGHSDKPNHVSNNSRKIIIV